MKFIVVDEQGPTNLAEFATLLEAEAYITRKKIIDAQGVYKGRYSIDVPESEVGKFPE